MSPVRRWEQRFYWLFSRRKRLTVKLIAKFSIESLLDSKYFLEIDCVILGYAKCKWTEEKGGGQRIDTNRAREIYFNESSCLLGDYDENQIELKPGLHKFDVSYALSSHLPTSFKCKNGSIKYKIRINIDRPWKLDLTYDFPFQVIHPLNLNTESITLRTPSKDELSKNFKMDFTSEPLYMSAAIPFSGYVPGQTVDVLVQVNNQSKTHVKEIKVYLKKIILLNSQKPKKKTKVLTESVAKVITDSVPVLSIQTFEEKLVIPSLPPNIKNCEVIQVFYELRVKAKTSGLSRSPKLKLPITIGTVPLECRADGCDDVPQSPICGNLRKILWN